MAIKINQNIFSLLVRRNLGQTTQNLERSFERISSGQRLNRAADDPAGMATSEQIRYEIRGVRKNQQNVSSALSLIGTAESYLDTMVSGLQRARELAIQGANDSLSAQDRQAIQAELNQIRDEIQLTAQTARFNDQFLLDGRLDNSVIQIGTRADERIHVSLADHRIDTLGSHARLVSDDPVSRAALGEGDLRIEGVPVPASEADGISTVDASASALAKARAINQVEHLTGVHAEARPTTVQGVQPVQAVNLNGATRSLQINGVNIGSVNVTGGDANGVLVNAINARSGSTGVHATRTAGGELRLEAADGRNVQIVTTGSIADQLGLAGIDSDLSEVYTARIEISSSRPYSINDANGRLGLAAPQQQVALDPATSLQHLSVADVEAAGEAIQSIDAALARCSDSRSTLGAVHNRLEDLAQTLARRVEDLSASDSRIRDTDFAFETAQLTQAQILQDAAIAMLTQANVAPQRALELLRSG